MSGRRNVVSPVPGDDGGGRGGRGRGGGGRNGGRNGGRAGRGGRGGGRGGGLPTSSRRSSSSTRDNRLVNISASASATSSRSRSNATASASAAPPAVEEVDPLCLKSQITILLNRNKSSANPYSFDGDHAKVLYQQVKDAKDEILDIVMREDMLGDLTARVREALNAPLHRTGGQRAGKKHYCEWMATVWMALRDVRTLMGSARRQTRAVSLGTYLGIMLDAERRANEVLNDNLRSLQNFRSDPMPPDEADRKWKENHAPLPISEFGSEHPQCACGHHYTDGPASNATVDDDNDEEMAEYFRQCEAMTKYLNGEGPQPVDENGNPLTKMPSAPKGKEKMIRCHCRQQRADPRTGQKCPIDCMVGGKKLPLRKCPVCSCTCDLFVPWKKYRNIMAAMSLQRQRNHSSSSSNNGREQATRFLNDSLRVNTNQQSSSLQHYSSMQQNGMISQETDIYSLVNNEGSLAQAFSIAGSQPEHQTVQHLRRQVDSIQHEGGPLMTKYGNIQNVGSRRNAASDRVRNNGLNPMPPSPILDLTNSPQEEENPHAHGNGDLNFMTDEEVVQYVCSLTSTGATQPPPQVPAPSAAPPPVAAVPSGMGLPPLPSPVAAAPSGMGLPPLPPPPPFIAAAPSGVALRPLPLPVPVAAPSGVGTPQFVRSSIAYADRLRQENRDNGGPKKERKRYVQIIKRAADVSDPLRRILNLNSRNSTPKRHKALMDYISDEED